MNAMTETKPMFEVGKSYRTRQGWIVKLNRLDRGAAYPLGGVFDRRVGTHWWTEAGRFMDHLSGNHEHDLMPGAIEDEKPEGADAVATEVARDLCGLTIEGLSRRLTAQALTIAGMAAKIEAQEERITILEGRVVGEVGCRMDVVCDRIEEHTKQIGTLQEAQIKTFARLDYHNIRLPTPDELPTKRTIKGGWVNVYRDIHGQISLGCVWSTEALAKSEAASRSLACIQIPDITEGEGL